MKKRTAVILLFAAIALFVYVRLQPLHALNRTQPYTGNANIRTTQPPYDRNRKTIILMADNDMTELFDLLAPFYLFSETGKANVYIAAQRKAPVATKNGPFVMPHFSYSELDALNLHPEVIVIPFMSSPESVAKTAWIKKHYSSSVIVLSVCDGARTAAASGLFDGKPLTSHATGYERLKQKFPKPCWVQNVRFTQCGNLFSTGGVSNAADGSLAVIEKLFGYDTMVKVLKSVNVPTASLQRSHSSIALNPSGMMTALNKMLFKKNKRIGIVLRNGANEMELAAMYDTYNRTLPQSVETVIPGRRSITTRHGLIVLPTGRVMPGTIDELHLLPHETLTAAQRLPFPNARLVSYDGNPNAYIIDACLEEIRKDYGRSFQTYVKRTLDYN